MCRLQKKVPDNYGEIISAELSPSIPCKNGRTFSGQVPDDFKAILDYWIPREPKRLSLWILLIYDCSYIRHSHLDFYQLTKRVSCRFNRRYEKAPRLSRLVGLKCASDGP